MKKLLGLVAAGALASLSAGAGAAPAASLVFTDVIGPALHQCLSLSAPTPCRDGTASTAGQTFTLDITDTGFIPGSLITAAELVIALADDGGSGDGNEKLDLVLDGTTIHHNANANHDVVVVFSDFSSLADGKLVVELSARDGDFFLEGATLTVVDDPLPGPELPDANATAVPAPPPLALVVGGLGAGLIGVAWRRRASR